MKKSAKTQTVIVTGNSRSGTTIATKLLKAIGVKMIGDLGMHKDKWAPTGYEENRTAYKINCAVFKDTGYADFFKQCKTNRIARIKSALKTDMEKKIKKFVKDKKGLWGFKNPACAYLIEQWIHNVENPYLIITSRNILRNSIANLNVWPNRLHDFHESLKVSIDIFNVIQRSIENIKCPTCLIDFELARLDYSLTIDRLCTFLDIELSKEEKQKALKFIDKQIIQKATSTSTDPVYIVNRDAE